MFPTHTPAQSPWLSAAATLCHRVAVDFRLFDLAKNAELGIATSVFGFRYDAPLDETRIRLVRLPRSLTSTSRLGLTIETFSLHDCPPYMALSYTWGPPSTKSRPYELSDRDLIDVNGKPFAIFPSLHHALVDLIAARPGEHIWIDGICINQKDPMERSAQVSIMDAIYTGAEETIIWLGECTERARRAAAMIQRIAPGAAERVAESFKNNEGGASFIADDPELLGKDGLPPMTSDDWQDIGDLVTRAWFGRVWIMQEVALSRNPTIVMGTVSFPWDDLGDAALLFNSSMAVIGVLRLKTNADQTPLVQGIVSAAILQILRAMCRENPGPYKEVIANMDLAAGIKDLSPEAMLVGLLLASKAFNATVLLDKVYGLLGILNHLARKDDLDLMDLKADYVSPRKDVIIQVGTHLYESTDSLHLLSISGYAGRQLDADGIPSWIPTFDSMGAPIMSATYENVTPFNAAFSTMTRFTVDQPRGRLRVRAVGPHLGSIEEVADLNAILKGGESQWLPAIRMLLHCGDGYRYRPTSQPIVEAFWRTLIMDTGLQERPATSALAPSFKSLMRIIAMRELIRACRAHPNDMYEAFAAMESMWTLANSRDELGLLPTSDEMIQVVQSLGYFTPAEVAILTSSEIDERVGVLMKDSALYDGILSIRMTQVRQLARTVRGYLCVVPVEAEAGDRVEIIHGCPTPMVLRMVPGETGCYRVVGDAYAHGAMAGEHITDKSTWREIDLV